MYGLKNVHMALWPGGVFLKVNNKKPANYGESLFLESFQEKTSLCMLQFSFIN